MKLTMFMTALIYSLAANAVTKTPKTIVFKPKDKPEILVKFDKPLPLTEQNVVKTDDEYTHTCDIKYYNSTDQGPRVNGHRFMYNDNVKVYVGDEQYWVTPAFGMGRSNAFESKWTYCTTLVYENPADCKSGKNAIRILIGLYQYEKPVYTFATDVKVGWERDTDKAYLYFEKGKYESYSGTVIEWH